jgi:alpha-amylase/alpha-mannosidase (GH57 family)
VKEQKFVCIHGHFYQPPRENPWHEELEREESAAPAHDWNERIAEECYRPNAAARVLGEDGVVVDLVNNYRSLSFNFGPTLLRWMQKEQPWAYGEILDADAQSAARLGHGNAMAQVYNHAIMPLCDLRDKRTQVRWGIADFVHRFGRRPEGMWLAECAVDDETLRVLAEEGIAFTVLSPFSAAAWRFTGQQKWQDCDGGRVPTGRAYSYDVGGGRSIALFFYDGPLARGIAFDQLLGHSSRLVEAVQAAHAGRLAQDGEPWLVHTATDGESYGHHFKFGDMALAAAFRSLRQDPSWTTTNYAAFLAAAPPRAEVRIHAPSAWSCAHGVGRWRDDCGCAQSSREGWTQKWRKPLRDALDLLRDRLGRHYEREMDRLAEDPWGVRDAYVEVVLDPEARRDAFWERRRKKPFDAATRVKFFQLLEMQRACMLMYTSCGWFFDDVAGPESVILLKYAARAIELSARTDGPDVEEDFLAILEQAVANARDAGTAADVYKKRAKTAAVDAQRIAVSHALVSIARPSERTPRLAVFKISQGHEDQVGSAPVPTLFGRVLVEDTRTGEAEEHLYAVVHFGGLDFRASVKPYAGEGDRVRTLEATRAAIHEHSTVRLMRALDDAFGRRFFTLQDALADLRHEIAIGTAAERFAVFMDFQRHLYEVNRPLLFSLVRLGVALPPELQGVVGRVLAERASKLCDELVDIGDVEGGIEEEQAMLVWRSALSRLDALREEAKLCGQKLELEPAGGRLGKAIVADLRALSESFSPGRAQALLRLLEVCRRLDVKPRLWELQTLHHRLVERTARDSEAARAVFAVPGLLDELDAFLTTRFARA